jgi:hypothetical protein
MPMPMPMAIPTRAARVCRAGSSSAGGVSVLRLRGSAAWEAWKRHSTGWWRLCYDITAFP